MAAKDVKFATDARNRIGSSCCARKLRVRRLLPPRISRLAAPITTTVHPASAAVMAAHKPALPAPLTSTSQVCLLGLH